VTAFYALNFDFAAYTTFRGELRTARGSVTAVDPTDTYEPGTKWSRRNERTQIVAVRYTYIDLHKVERHGISYRPNAQVKVGAAVTIEHPVGRPEVSGIRGYRTAPIDAIPVALPIMAGVGIVLLAVSVLMRSRVQRRESD
jgi:hypothetical protein